MSSPLFDLFPEANSVALAGIQGVPASIKDHVLNEYLRIVEATEDLDRLYLPRLGPLGQGQRIFSHYLIGVAEDTRYMDSFRELRSLDDAKSSMTITHQALGIYFGRRFDIGPILGFSRDGGPAAYVLALPGRTGRSTELKLWAWQPPLTPFVAWPFGTLAFDRGFSQFLEEVARVYFEQRNKRWIVAATAYTAGITAASAFESILNLAVAMEALLNDDRDQVGFRLRLYLALLVGRNLTERIQIEKDVKEFYGLRSKLVHGQLVRLEDKQVTVIARVGHWLSTALRKTCGMTEEEVWNELQYMMMLGAPRYSRTKNVQVYTQAQLARFIAEQNGISAPWESRFFLSEPDSYGDRELWVEFVTESDTFGPYDVHLYLHGLVRRELPAEVSRYACEVSEEAGEYVILVSYATDD